MRLLEGARLHDLTLEPDQEAVLLQAFGPTAIRQPYTQNEAGKLRATATRVCAMEDAVCEKLWRDTLDHYAHRHPDFQGTVRARWDRVRHGLLDANAIDTLRRDLIGAYFLSEYTFKSTAYFNPSMVPHPQQDGGDLRVILSVRAVGEGHISSVAFREGRIDAAGTLTVEDAAGVYEAGVLRGFSLRRDAISEAKIADVRFEANGPLSSRILFPLTAKTSNGLEDLRLVRFRDGGEDTYYGTYTAYDGRQIESQLLGTDDFKRFELGELEGDAVGNKGMGLFPRRVNGHYAMIGRQDAERVWLLYSDDLGVWSGGEVIMEPAYPHEAMHMGNCGSPIETPEGWLLLTHGVGPVREYTIGAALLDLDDPSKVIARTDKPLVATDQDDRHGYVPNAVYTCGALVHEGRLVMPFGLADYETRSLDIPVSDLIAQMARL